MSGLVIALIVLAVIALIAVMSGVGIYNQLVTLKNRYQNAFSQIEVQLKRRYDLIPNLVETAKGYMAHERGTLEAVIPARNQAVQRAAKGGRQPGRPAGDEGPRLCRARIERRARPVVRRGRSVSGSEGQPEHAAAERGDHVDRKQGRVRPPGVQRRRHGVQHLQANVPAVVFAGIVGHGQNAELLQFDHGQIAEAPKVSFS